MLKCATYLPISPLNTLHTPHPHKHLRVACINVASLTPTSNNTCTSTFANPTFHFRCYPTKPCIRITFSNIPPLFYPNQQPPTTTRTAILTTAPSNASWIGSRLHAKPRQQKRCHHRQITLLYHQPLLLSNSSCYQLPSMRHGVTQSTPPNHPTFSVSSPRMSTHSALQTILLIGKERSKHVPTTMSPLLASKRPTSNGLLH